jgi:glutamyl-tRNA reductase
VTLLAFGINHKTAPIDIREKVAFAPEKVATALTDLTKNSPVTEAAIISTCNRTELICELEFPDLDSVLYWFGKYHGIEHALLKPYVYNHPDQEAVRHILRVASGLDSLVLGEPQILGQVKTAYVQASDAGTIGSLLNQLFQHTFSVAKQVRTDTAIGSSAVSVAFAAVSLAKQIFSNLNEHTALLIGAGETIELVARHLKEQGIKNIVIANRTIERAQLVAKQFNGTGIAIADMPDYLAKADIIISSTASQLPILGKGAVERAMKKRKHRPMFMVDIAVPRDIEPEVAELKDIYLYTVDDLTEVIEENQRSRQEAALQAEEIIENQVLHYMKWLQSLEAVSTIRNYRARADKYRDDLTANAIKQITAGKNADVVIKELSRKLTNKLVHAPTVQIHQAAYEGRKDFIKIAHELLDIKDDLNE